MAKETIPSNTPVLDWYAAYFPSDTAMIELLPRKVGDVPYSIIASYVQDGIYNADEVITFDTYWNTLSGGFDVYPLMGNAADSIVRERIFTQLAEIRGVEYGQIYDLWLESADI